MSAPAESIQPVPGDLKLFGLSPVFAALSGLLVFSLLIGLTQGGYGLSIGQIVSIFGAQIGLTLPWDFAPHEETILLSIRLPRLVLAIAVGAALGVSGAVLQSLFRNPLAEPGLVGVSSGAALAAVTVIVGVGSEILVFGVNLSPYALPMAAFGGGLAATTILYLLAQRVSGDPVPTMLLIGIALNAVAMAGIGLAQYLSTDTQLRILTFWMLGGLGAARWESLVLPLIAVTLAVTCLLRLAQPLNAYLLGSSEARHLGIDPRRLTRHAVFFVALGVGAAVAVSGIIAFVGLIVPHLLRLILGPDNRILLPGSALLGASFLVFMDLIARSIVVPAELPIGLVCSALGGGFFLWLLLTRERRAGL